MNHSEGGLRQLILVQCSGESEFTSPMSGVQSYLSHSYYYDNSFFVYPTLYNNTDRNRLCYIMSDTEDILYTFVRLLFLHP